MPLDWYHIRPFLQTFRPLFLYSYLSGEPWIKAHLSLARVRHGYLGQEIDIGLW